MDTKSKNKHLPAFAPILLVCFAALALLLAIDINNKRAYIYGNPFFQGDFFYGVQVFMNVRDITKYRAEYENYNRLSEKEKVSEDTIRQWREQFDYLTNEMLSGTIMIPELESSADEELKLSPPVASSLRALQEKTGQWMSAEWSKQVEDAWQSELLDKTKKYISKRDSEYEELKRTAARLDPIIKYSIIDKKNHQTYTNRLSNPNGALETQENSETTHTMIFPLQKPNKQLIWLNDYFKANQLEGSFTFYAAVEPADLAFGTEVIMFKDYVTLLGIRKQLQFEFAGLVAVVVAIILLLVYMRKNGVKENVWSGTFTATWQCIPLDIRILIFILASFYALTYGRTVYDWDMLTPSNSVYRWSLLAMLIACISIYLNDALLLYRRKGAVYGQWKAGYILTLSRLMKAAFVNKKILLKSILIFLLIALLGLSVCLGLQESESGVWSLLSVIYIAAYMLIAVPYLVKRVGTLNYVLAGMSEICAGRLNVALEERGKGELSHMIRQLNNMKQGFQTALDLQLRSERSKSELISNVSHDLKTPLTSMINYIDLLKKESPLPGESNHYVHILEKKTQRLKMLIDDLFEVSQFSSGAVVLALETVNVAALLQQALAECSDKIEASRLHFRIHIERPHIFAQLDGNKTWRVFENLIHNALNYSMPDTRVHLSLTEEQEHVVLKISNVSAYEILFDAQDLFERFKRGDTSRNTEGSGLGLAIAKSIVELQGGRLYIEIEGDYFKVTVNLKK